MAISDKQRAEYSLRTMELANEEVELAFELQRHKKNLKNTKAWELIDKNYYKKNITRVEKRIREITEESQKIDSILFKDLEESGNYSVKLEAEVSNGEIEEVAVVFKEKEEAEKEFLAVAMKPIFPVPSSVFEIKEVEEVTKNDVEEEIENIEKQRKQEPVKKYIEEVEKELKIKEVFTSEPDKEKVEVTIINKLAEEDKEVEEEVVEKVAEKNEDSAEEENNKEPLKNPEKWWGYIPSTFLEETENLLNTPYSDDVIEYKLVVTDTISDDDGSKERKTSSDTKTVVVGEQAQTGQNPNVDGRLYSLKVVENYPLIKPPELPKMDWKLPAPNDHFPNDSVGGVEEITDDFKVSYFVVGNNKINRLPFDGSRIRYSRHQPVLLKVEFGSSLQTEDIFLTGEGNAIIKDPNFNMHMHIKCFEKQGNFYVEKLKYSGKTGLSSSVVLTPFSYKFFNSESESDGVFFVEFLYPNMTGYDKIEFYFEAELAEEEQQKSSFYSKEYSLWASDFVVTDNSEANYFSQYLDEWRWDRKLPKPVRDLFSKSESEEEKIKEASVFNLVSDITDTVTSAVAGKILKTQKVISKPIKSATKLSKKIGGFR